MDTEQGRFVEESEAKEWMERLGVGEVVKIKGAEFKVLEIGERTVRLELMSAKDRQEHRIGEMFKEAPPITDLVRRGPMDGLNRAERRRRDAEQRKGKR